MKPENHSSPNSTLNHPPEKPDFHKEGPREVPGCPQGLDDGALLAAQRYSFRVPPEFAALVNWQNPADPLLRQIIPSAQELLSPAGFSADPLDETQFLRAPGLIAKYPGRVLLRLTGVCPIHCRYCFRRHDTFADVPNNPEGWQPALEWIRRHEEVGEVIFSGGDPLMVANGPLADLSAQIAAIAHVRRLRLHTRMPVCTPQRINDGLLEWLTGSRLRIFMVIHVNHPAELGKAGCDALGRLVDAGVPVLNQSVLLKGVNDCAKVLAELSECLLQNRVIPYYLHRLDPVVGAAHFHVDDVQAQRLIGDLRDRLAGFAVPRLARETIGKLSKEVL
ncbi:MAG TPA: KamA family radical SAM protein [Magnetococcales bacterium]|nr:KamA family radical SAM protein [Magnetococcales bacterium]